MAKAVGAGRRKPTTRRVLKKAPSPAAPPRSKEQVEPAQFQKRARSSSALAWERLEALLAHEDAKVAMAAAQAILDRAWGKVGNSATAEEGPRMPLVVQVVTGIDRAREISPAPTAAPTAAPVEVMDEEPAVEGLTVGGAA